MLLAFSNFTLPLSRNKDFAIEGRFSKFSIIVALLIVSITGIIWSNPSCTFSSNTVGAGSVGLGGTVAFNAAGASSRGFSFALVILFFGGVGFVKLSNTNFLYSTALGA